MTTTTGTVYTAIGIRKPDSEDVVILGVIEGSHNMIGPDSYSDLDFEVVCDDVVADDPADAMVKARAYAMFGDLPVYRSADQVQEGDQVVYDDDSVDTVTRAARTDDGDVLLWFEGVEEPASYDPSAQLLVVPADA